MNAITLNVSLDDRLSEFVADKVGHDRPYEDVGEYIRDLIERDADVDAQAAFETLKAELQRAFAAPESEARPFDREEFMARMRERHG